MKLILLSVILVIGFFVVQVNAQTCEFDGDPACTKASECIDSNTVRTYTGTCNVGTCEYSETDTSCAEDETCSDGACVTVNKCAGITCEPSTKTCSDGSTAAASNSCNSDTGLCSDNIPVCESSTTCAESGNQVVYTVNSEEIIFKKEEAAKSLLGDLVTVKPEIITNSCNGNNLNRTSMLCNNGETADPKTAKCVPLDQTSKSFTYNGKTVYLLRTAQTGFSFYSQNIPTLTQKQNPFVANNENSCDGDTLLIGNKKTELPGFICITTELGSYLATKEDCQDIYEGGVIVGAKVPIIGTNPLEYNEFRDVDGQTAKCANGKITYSYSTTQKPDYLRVLTALFFGPIGVLVNNFLF